MPDDSSSAIINLGKFVNGINNVNTETDLPEGSLTTALNVDIDKSGNIFSSPGYTKVLSGSGIHSLFNNYFVENTDLKLFDGTTATVVTSGLNPTKFLAWESVLGSNYYSDGLAIRSVDKGLAGIPTPPSNPPLTETTGLLSAGTYQVTMVWQDPASFEIGGALISNTITVSDNAGILCSDIPVSPDGYNTKIYVSTQNGEELYQNGVVLNSITSYTIINSTKSTKILNTQFMEPLPGGHIIRHFKARLYVANDNVLWFSEVFRYGLRKTNKNFFQFPSRISIVQPVEDGIFVVADKTYFLQGAEPKDMRQQVVSDDYAIEGTGITEDGTAFGIDSDMKVGYWFSNKGAVLGLPGGSIKQLTENKYAFDDDIASGVTLYKELNGIKQMVTSFSNTGQSSSFSFGAQATSQIIRNGIVIP